MTAMDRSTVANLDDRNGGRAALKMMGIGKMVF
jgi:hypothetical protein